MYFSFQCSYFSQHYANWRIQLAAINNTSLLENNQTQLLTQLLSTIQTASIIASYKLNTVHVFGHFGVYQLDRPLL